MHAEYYVIGEVGRGTAVAKFLYDDESPEDVCTVALRHTGMHWGFVALKTGDVYALLWHYGIGPVAGGLVEPKRIEHPIHWKEGMPLPTSW